MRYSRKGDWKSYVGCFVTYVLAMMAKPISLPLPVLMVLMDYWPLSRIKWKTIREKIPFFVIAAVFAYITIESQGRTAVVTQPGEHGIVRIVLTLCHNIIFYLYKMAWPVNMSSYYVFPEPMGISHPMVMAGVIGTGILVVLLIVSLRWTRVLLTGWLIFFVAIFPAMGVIGFTIVIASDKFAYLPSVGILMILASFLTWLCGVASEKKSVMLRVAPVVVVLILASAEAVGSRRVLSYWRDTVTLCERMVSMTPEAVPLRYKLARALGLGGRGDEAIEHYRRILQLDSSFIKAYNGLGGELIERGDIDEAIDLFGKGLRIASDDFDLHRNLAFALKSKNRLDEAISEYRKAISIKPKYYWVRPNFAQAKFELADVLRSRGQLDEAIELYREVLEVRGNYAEVHTNLGNALSSQDKLDEAIESYRKALELNPNIVVRRNNLAWHLKMTGRFDEAMEHFEEALRLDADSVPCLLGMAQLLIEHPNPEKRDANMAVALAGRAAELTKYSDVTILDTLASAYAAAGQNELAATMLSDLGFALARQNRIDAAIKYYKKAIEIDPDNVKAKEGLKAAMAKQKER